MQGVRATVLLANNQQETRKLLDLVLDESAFKVAEYKSGRQACQFAAMIKPDIVLVDADLPDMDAREVVVSLREWAQMPIIVIGRQADSVSVVEVLNAGADDYVARPFNVKVLLARIKANLRKIPQQPDEPSGQDHEEGLENGPLYIDAVRHQILIHNQPIPFTPKEFNLLRYFVSNQGKMLTHKEILREVWGASHSSDTQYLRVFIGQLRKKIGERSGIQDLIVTAPGIGYRMEAISSRAPQHRQLELGL